MSFDLYEVMGFLLAVLKVLTVLVAAPIVACWLMFGYARLRGWKCRDLTPRDIEVLQRMEKEQAAVRRRRVERATR